MKVISRGHRVETSHFVRSFDWVEHKGSGFSFDCTEDGVVDFSEMMPEGLANYYKCINGEHNVIDMGIVEYTNSYYEPTLIECDCGEELQLHNPLTNECVCGRLYNGCGQALAPRCQWDAEDRLTYVPDYNS